MRPSGQQRRRDRTKPSLARKDEPRVRLIADAMFGSLSRKLRVLGFDTAYYRNGDDEGILSLAAEQGRVIITADKGLSSLAARGGATSILLTGSSDAARVRALAKGASQLGFAFTRGESRCSVCNGDLRRVAKSELKGRLPPSVEARHRLFFRCVSCGKVYWKGGHWKKLRSYDRMMREAR